ncbi:S-adenosyl-L-methionine-dependent methyltransferase [Chlamydoabsidia padenii]|nr:S-adenosyl-L-methionine-dependent methyltransferase [Chlamydoabsidia padenii]
MSDKVTYKGSSYLKFRPTYSDRLYSLIYDFHKGACDVAVDIGTGTGQVAIELSKKFKHVHGVDRLSGMINNAIPKENVTYSVGSAEQLNFLNHSVDMVTVATAFHWFDHAVFFDQVKRVLKSDGTLAVWSYYFPVIKNNEKATAILNEITRMNGPLQRYSDPNVKYVINMYRDFTFPFKTVDYYISPSSEDVTQISKPCGGSLMEKTMSLSDFGNYLKTASAYVNYTKEQEEAGDASEDPVDSVIDRIAEAMRVDDKEATLIDLEWPLVLVLCSNV